MISQNYSRPEIPDHIPGKFPSCSFLTKSSYITFKLLEVKIDREINNSSEKNQLKNDLKNDMKQLKNALLNNNIDFVTKKYLQWFKINQPLLLPQNMKKHLGYDLKARTSEYLYYSFYINQEIEVSDLMESFHKETILFLKILQLIHLRL